MAPNRFTNFLTKSSKDVFASLAEDEVCKILEELGYVVKKHSDMDKDDPPNIVYSQVPFRRMRIDFALVNAKIAIEVQGDYWHANTTTQLSATQAQNKMRDQRKENSLHKEGWRLIKLWEEDIQKRPERIRLHLHNSILKLIEV